MIKRTLQIGPGVQMKHCRFFTAQRASFEIRTSIAVCGFAEAREALSVEFQQQNS
jgi:hypothetical protein